MKRLFIGLLAVAALGGLSPLTTRTASAQQPQYGPQPQYADRSQVTEPPAAQPSPEQPLAPPCAGPPHYLFLAPSYHGYGHLVPAQAYAYGWFGVCSQPHAVFHWDYFDHRWIWR